LTRTKLWRLSLTAILGFGWLFLTPAYSDDPLQIAAAQIQQLEADVQKLNDKAATQALIDIANNKYDAAVAAKENLQDKQTAYDNAVAAQLSASDAKNDAQSAVDNQQVIRDAAYTNMQSKLSAYQDAQTTLNAHIALYGNGAYQGVSFQIFPLSRYWDGTAYLTPGAGVMCQGSIATFDAWAGWGGICGLSENIIGIFKAKVTFPSDISTVRFAGITDDGFRLYINGSLATSQWQEQGATWSPYTQWYDISTNKTLDLEAWWYNGGGPGSMNVAYMTPEYLTGIPYEWLSFGNSMTPEQQTERTALITDHDTKYNQYQIALSTYNIENNKLIQYQSTLSTATYNYSIAVNNKELKQSDLNTANSNYNSAISEMQEAIANAQNEYNKQWDFEEKQRVAAAIAQAMANQPQPSPEPSINPEPTVSPDPEPSIDSTPEPTPEQTKLSDPTPEPTPETTHSEEPNPSPEPSPTVEPSPEPSPQPTDINPVSKPEPSQDPVVVPDKTNNSPVSDQMANLIADLTNSSTLTKLSPEQKAAVAGTLGIRAEEIAKIAELAKSEPTVAKALEEFGSRANENLKAPMPYTLADATTEIATEQLLADPIGALTSIDLSNIDFSNLGSDMTDDQREKAQEVIIPVVIASNIVAAAMTRRK